MNDVPTPSTPAGWYEDTGSLRYWNGDRWTDQRAPLAPDLAKTLTQSEITRAVFFGVLGAMFIVWLGAQLSPEHIYLPVKFVVKELPNL